MITSTSQNTHETDTANNVSCTTISTILTLAIPTFGQLIAEPAFVLIDTAIVGHVGGQALAGLSVGSTIVLTVVGLCVFLAYSTTSQVGRLLGAGKRREGLEAGVDGLWLAGIIGVVVSVMLFAIARPLCMAMGAQGGILHNAVDYVACRGVRYSRHAAGVCGQWHFSWIAEGAHHVGGGCGRCRVEYDFGSAVHYRIRLGSVWFRSGHPDFAMVYGR